MFDFCIRRKWLSLVLVMIAAIQIWRALVALQQAQFLLSLSAGPSPWYIALTNVVWAAAFGVCILMVVQRVRFAPVAAILAGVLNQAHHWLDRLWFSRSTESMQTLGFAALLSVIFLIMLCLPAALLKIKFTKDEV